MNALLLQQITSNPIPCGSPMVESHAIIAYSAAILCGCLTLACVYVAWIRRRTHRFAGIINNCLFDARGVYGHCYGQHQQFGAVTTWHRVQLLALSFLPCAWFCLASFTLAAKRYQQLAAFHRASSGPTSLVFIFLPHEYIISRPSSLYSSGTITLGFAGKVIQVMVVAGSVVALMNLERTNRAAVSTLRWRVKYVLLGCATILATRFTLAREALIYGSIAPSIDTISTAAVAISVVLIMVGLLRDGSFNIDLYPSIKSSVVP